ncbi:MAG: HAD family phosphatase [Aureibaculum sp.]|nr:HAD family phosphatase [Aureibaculum sp.]
MNKIDTIIFDLGGVLIDWNPEYVYREVFNGDQQKIDWFLNTICTHGWNVKQDAGRSIQKATELLVAQYPEYEEWIRIFYDRWEDMLGGTIPETVTLLNKLKQANNHRLYALTNWSAETFPVAMQRYEFLQHFEGILVSGEEKTIKPFRKIYEILLERYQINPLMSVFIDDNLENVEVAKKFGIKGVHFKSTQQLREELTNLGVQF